MNASITSAQKVNTAIGHLARKHKQQRQREKRGPHSTVLQAGKSGQYPCPIISHFNFKHFIAEHVFYEGKVSSLTACSGMAETTLVQTDGLFSNQSISISSGSIPQSC